MFSLVVKYSKISTFHLQTLAGLGQSSASHKGTVNTTISASPGCLFIILGDVFYAAQDTIL